MVRQSPGKQSRANECRNVAARAATGGVATGPIEVPRTRPEESALATAKTAAANVLKRNRSLEARIAQRLEGGGSQWRPAEWLLFHAGVFILVAVLGLLIGGGNQNDPTGGNNTSFLGAQKIAPPTVGKRKRTYWFIEGVK